MFNLGEENEESYASLYFYPYFIDAIYHFKLPFSISRFMDVISYAIVWAYCTFSLMASREPLYCVLSGF